MVAEVRRVGQARKRDSNEKAIVEALEARGAIIYHLSGKGIPDLLVSFRGRWWPVEVKSAKGRLTPAQVKADRLSPFQVVRSVEEAIETLGQVLR